ncbi:hypothetical protein [Streptomyces gilvus]|uniref:hypothetical protein n=1 Tax=Streptomyces gilvus TaxID=2920937 RepID=UPI001F1021D2|nr:hypothetical protein [Streptomyces sp. CME 23]MCH5672921.1 hypothetical protein [Streptomyces sp. CME 23]
MLLANLFTVAHLDPTALRRALASALTVPAEAVDVADADGDQEVRRWDAPVLCTYRLLSPPGDLALELDISVSGATASALTEADLASRLALWTTTSILHPALDLTLDSAYWIRTPDGRAVRCRLETIDSDEDTTYRVDMAEQAVPDLPRATVDPLPEALDHEPLPTPVSDAFLAGYPRGTTSSAEGRVHYALRVWERLVRRLESGWQPSGTYREDLFMRDLEARDCLAQLVQEIDGVHADALRSAIADIDRIFRNHTGPGLSREPDRRWWHRRVEQAPWRHT